MDRVACRLTFVVSSPTRATIARWRRKGLPLRLAQATNTGQTPRSGTMTGGRKTLSRLVTAWIASVVGTTSTGHATEPPAPTREFQIRGDRPFLGGEPVRLWGVRSGNALYSWNVTERHVNCLDT